jgi:hypothetical protein
MPCLRYQSAAMIEHPDCTELAYHRCRGYNCKRVFERRTGTLFKGGCNSRWISFALWSSGVSGIQSGVRVPRSSIHKIRTKAINFRVIWRRAFDNSDSCKRPFFVTKTRNERKAQAARFLAFELDLEGWQADSEVSTTFKQRPLPLRKVAFVQSGSPPWTRFATFASPHKRP